MLKLTKPINETALLPKSVKNERNVIYKNKDMFVELNIFQKFELNISCMAALQIPT
jgi:hypothetical protein